MLLEDSRRPWGWGDEEKVIMTQGHVDNLVLADAVHSYNITKTAFGDFHATFSNTYFMGVTSLMILYLAQLSSYVFCFLYILVYFISTIYRWNSL